MKKAEREKIISECVAEYENTNFPEKYPSGSWKQFMEDVKNLYGIVRRHFGRAESKRITVDYFADTEPSTFLEKLTLSFTLDALTDAK